MTETETGSESRRALRELIALLQEVDDRYLGDEWGAPIFGDLPDGYRSVANLLEGGLFLMFECDPERPFFRPIVSRTRKMLGDNADAIYYTAPIRSDRAYRVTGNVAGAVYLSFTVERNSSEGGYSTETAGVINDDQIDIAADGSFEIFFGGAPRERNWLGLVDGASEIIVRCYFEEPTPTAADPNQINYFMVERLFNVREGVRRKDDVLPWRVMHEPIPDGPSAGMHCPPEELSMMLDRYYALRGWDADGVPTRARLGALGL